jgi:multiple sugar transport system substrate-binding protein
MEDFMYRRLALFVVLIVFGSTFLVSAQDNSAEIEVTSDRVGYPDAENSISVHLISVFSQESTLPLYGDPALAGMLAWVEAHPDWAIETRTFSNSVASLPGLLEEARAGRAPDCANLVPEYFPLFKDAGYLQPITQYFTEEERQDFFPWVQETVSLGTDDFYAYWIFADLRVLYYRTDLVPEAPTTWDELRDYAVAAHEQDPSVDGFLFNGGRWAGTWADWIAYFWSQGGQLTAEDGSPIVGESPNREYMINLLSFMKELIDSGASPERVVNILTYGDMVQAASLGTTAMFMGTDSHYNQLRALVSEEEFAKWAITRLPGRTADQTATTSGGWAFGVITDDPEKIALCVDFFKTVYGPSFNAASTLLPPRVSTFAEFEEFQAPIYQSFLAGLQFGHPQPIVSYTSAMSASFQVMVGDVLTGAATPEEAFDTFAEEVQSAYEESQE